MGSGARDWFDRIPFIHFGKQRRSQSSDRPERVSLAVAPITPQVIEIDCADPARTSIAARLAEGHVILLRNVTGVRRLRAALEEYLRASDPAGVSDHAAFFANGAPPGVATVLALSRAIKAVRADRFVVGTAFLAAYFRKLRLCATGRLDGGDPAAGASVGNRQRRSNVRSFRR